MKKLLGILVIGLLWCNTSFALCMPNAGYYWSCDSAEDRERVSRQTEIDELRQRAEDAEERIYLCKKYPNNCN